MTNQTKVDLTQEEFTKIINNTKKDEAHKILNMINKIVGEGATIYDIQMALFNNWNNK